MGADHVLSVRSNDKGEPLIYGGGRFMSLAADPLSGQ